MKSFSSKQRNGFLILFAMLFFALIIMGLSYSGVLNVNASVEPLKGSYHIGETVGIPDREIEDNQCDKIIYYPSGSAIRANSVLLSEEGQYTVEYSAKVDGKIIREYESFNVYNSVYSFTGNKSTAKYGLDTSIYNTGKTALNVQLAQGEKLNFNKIIDLSKLNGEDFINFYATPKTKGVAEVQGIYFVLTDIYDVTNTVTFQFKNVAYNGSSYVYTASYVTAGHGTESPRAWTYDSSERKWKLRVNDKFGTGAYMSLYGMAENYDGFPQSESYCGFGLDLNTKQAYVYEPKTLKSEIIDLDNPAYFDNIWKGFTTGEVRLSVEAYNYTGSTFNLNITKVAGYDFYEDDYIIDNVAPEITVESEGYDLNNLEDGNVGYEYKVFNAKAFDKNCGNCAVTTKVYYGFDSSSSIQLEIKNGKVKTPTVGKYKIEYTAKDIFGNTAVKNVFFSVKGTPTDIDLDFNGAYVTSCKIGEKIILPDAVVSGGTGNVSVEITTDKEGRLDLDKMTFIPTEIGKVRILYTAVDMTGYSKSIYFDVDVSENDKPAILNDFYIPDYLFGGLKYQFASVKGYDFNSNSEVDLDVCVNGVKCNNNIYAPEDKKGEILQPSYFVTVEYVSGSDVIFSKDIEVLDVKYDDDGYSYYDVSGYWTQENFSKSLGDNFITFENTSATSTTETIKYTKSILFEAFSIGLNLFNAKNAGSVTLKLSDIDDFNNNLTISLVKDTGLNKTVLYVNGEETVYTLGQGGFFDDNFFNISIEKGYLKDSSNVNLDLRNIFTAKKVSLEVLVDDITLGSSNSVSINQICSFTVSSGTKRDSVQPIVSTQGVYADFATVGEKVTVYPVIAEDILDTFISYSVSVYMVENNGNTVTVLKDADATVSHQVDITSYGTLRIMYKITDGAGQVRKPEYSIRVVNLIKPEISVDKSLLKENYKVNETINLPTATATDDIDGNVTVKYFVVSPRLVPKLVIDGKYTPTIVGDYIFRIYAVDNSGNVTLKDISFKVVK